MRAWADRAAAAPLRALVLALVVGLVTGLAAGAIAQDTRRTAIWDTVANDVEARLADPDTTTPELEAMRERLVLQRAEALDAEQALSPAVDELNGRLQALGPPPADGAADAPEIAARRRDLNQQIAAAQAPVLEAQEALRRTDQLIGEIDKQVRGRFSAELMSRGPSPLLPATWAGAVREVREAVSRTGTGVVSSFDDPVGRRTALRRLPLSVMMVAAGIAITLMIRRWVGEWVETRLMPAARGKAVAWVGALHNLARLIVPVMVAGLLFGAFDPAALVGSDQERQFFRLPAFVAVLIGAGWLAASLFAPRLEAFRLVPLDDPEARRGARLVRILGVVTALQILVQDATELWDLSTTTQTALSFPLVVIGALSLWRVAGLMKLMRGRLGAHVTGQSPDTPTATVVLRALLLLERVVRGIAVLAPVLGAVGYLPAANYLIFPTVLTLGLMGAARVFFDLLNKTAQSLLVPPSASPSDADGGLIPVAVAVLVSAASLPILALIWGARTSDLADAWMAMREGVTVGGMRLSATVILTLIVVFAAGLALTRLFQALLRGSVLPRTKFDTGGRNAVLAGVGYLGFTITALAAIAAAGLDLSNIAIVAGALSVGIGFGLQNIVSNFVSGIILLVERPVKEGDWIEVGGFSGYVRGIKVRSTEIETFDRASVILPNSDLVAGTVLNRTHSGMSGRLQVPVSVTYEADPKEVEAILLTIAETHPLVLEDPAPRVLFLELGPDSMNFELRCWLRDVNFTLSARSDMNYEIVEKFRAAGVRVQFYGRDLPPEAPPEPPAVTLQRAKKET